MQYLAGQIPRSQHRRGRLRGRRSGEIVYPKRLWPIQRLRQRVGVVAPTGSAPTTISGAVREPRRTADRHGKGDQRGLVPVSRLVLQPVPGSRTEREHPGQLDRNQGFRCVRDT